LRINEIFHSIQGESTRMGERCVFVRLTGCDLRCTYCDTAYAFYEGSRMSIAKIEAEVARHGCPLVEVTGGEPLLQRNTPALLARLCDLGYTVLLETSGAHDIGRVDARVCRIMDLKCPSSGEVHRNLASNLLKLTGRDEVKFVVGTEEDYRWAARQIASGPWAQTVQAVLISPVHGIELRWLAERMIADRLPARLQVQLHKLIWSPAARGV
jgi:7-carboxy-7-deazaguanine synthase